MGGDLLTVTGSGFPTTVGEITVELADGTACTTQTLTLTTITCILDPPISGEGPEDVIVKAYDEERIPGQVLVITPFEANSVTPQILDIAGGETLTITGRGFPSN